MYRLNHNNTTSSITTHSPVLSTVLHITLRPRLYMRCWDRTLGLPQIILRDLLVTKFQSASALRLHTVPEISLLGTKGVLNCDMVLLDEDEDYKVHFADSGPSLGQGSREEQFPMFQSTHPKSVLSGPEQSAGMSLDEAATSSSELSSQETGSEASVEITVDETLTWDDIEDIQQDPADTPLHVMQSQTDWEVLGVGWGDSTEKIKQSFYRLSLRYHPDKNPDDPDAAAKFDRVGPSPPRSFCEKMADAGMVDQQCTPGNPEICPV